MQHFECSFKQLQLPGNANLHVPQIQISNKDLIIDHSVSDLDLVAEKVTSLKSNYNLIQH